MRVRCLARPMLLMLIGAASSSALARALVPPAKDFRITGVALSTRDGSPIPYCRITANAILTNDATSTAATPSAGQRGPGSPAGGDRGDVPMGQSPGGTRSAGSPQMPVQVTADSSGRFSLEMAHAGTWRLAATARGFRGQNYDEHEGFYSAVVLSDAVPTYRLTFRLRPDSVLTGLIFDEAGEPVASAQVMAQLIPPAGPDGTRTASRGRTASGRTDDRGRYEIGGLAPGSYRLRVQAQPWYASGVGGFQPGRSIQASGVPSPDPSLDFVYPITWFPGTDDEATADTIKLADGEERQADFHLLAIPSVHLKVPRADDGNPPAPGDQRNRQQARPASVTRVGGDGAMGYQVSMTGSIGNEWDFGGLAPGTYEIRTPGPDGKSNDVRQIEIRPGSATVITMEGAKPLVRVQLKLDGLSSSDKATVEFIDSETGARINSSNPSRGRGGPPRDGPFESRGDVPLAEESDASSRTVMLPPHEFLVQVTGNSGAYLTGIAADGAKVAGRIVTVSGPATLTLHLADKHGSLEGVAQIGGRPAAGAMVLLVPATFGMAGELKTIQRDETNTDGSFRMGSVIPGQYIVVAIDHGWNVDWRDSATLGQYLLHGTPVDLRTIPKAQEQLEAVAAK